MLSGTSANPLIRVSRSCALFGCFQFFSHTRNCSEDAVNQHNCNDGFYCGHSLWFGSLKSLPPTVRKHGST